MLCSGRHALLLLERVVGEALYCYRTFPPTICLSVCVSVCLPVCPVSCGETADGIWMPFGVVGGRGPWIRQVVGFGDRSRGRGSLGRKCRAAQLKPMGTRRLRALYPDYSGKTCCLGERSTKRRSRRSPSQVVVLWTTSLSWSRRWR